jgi:hypothetical protein
MSFEFSRLRKWEKKKGLTGRKVSGLTEIQTCGEYSKFL